MFKFVTESLMTKLVGSFLIAALIPLVPAAYLAYTSARDGLREHLLTDLVDERNQAARGVGDYLRTSLADMSYLIGSPSVHAMFKAMGDHYGKASVLDYAKSHPDAPIDAADRDFKKPAADHGPVFLRFLDRYREERGYEDILLVVGEDAGLVMYTAKELSDLGTSLKSGPLKDTELARVWRETVKERKPVLGDFRRYEPSKTVSSFLGVPVFKSGDDLYGVAVLRFGPKSINEIVDRAGRIGKTGDAFLVGQDGLLRSKSRQLGDGLLNTKVPLASAAAAFQGKTGLSEVVSPLGETVLTAWMPVGLTGTPGVKASFDWAVVTRISTAEAYAAAKKLSHRIISIALIAGLAVAVLAYLAARAIVVPLKAIAGQISRISEGDLTVGALHLKGNDELSKLADSTADMVRNFRDQMKGLMGSAQALSASAQEISLTVSQVAENTSKISAAVAETTATAEQVRQAASVSGEKARDVAQTSRKAVDISEEGESATRGTVERMNLIRRQMESIADTVVKLSEESSTIERIIVTVEDIAAQSNLLAVNASIEAARAGDQGRGFAVVANEIKILSDQSKEATDQVRSILENTRKNVGAVVMATEEGTKAVDRGVEQSGQAGEAIRNLSSVVESASQAAEIIEASSGQQFVGVGQVSGAMAEINRAIHDNLDGVRDLETASRQLEDLGLGLEETIGKYRF
ncbi:MAG: methyl-accepting chemotaxis protein [Pseudomonadota bacterium]